MDITEEIRKKIIDGAFEKGSSITEEWLSKKFNVSRTPIRESLIRLHNEGFVTLVKNKGAFVNEISLSDCIEIFQIRIPLEGFAGRLSLKQIDFDQVSSILNELKTSDGNDGKYGREMPAGSKLHDLIIDSCGNERMKIMLRTYRLQYFWAKKYAWQHPQRMEKSRIEHLSIAESLLKNDPFEIEKRIRHHLESTLQDIMSLEIFGGR